MLATNSKVWVDAEYQDAARDLIQELADESRKEEGIVDYQISEDIEDPRLFRFFEVYEDEGAFNAHMETEHVQEFVAGLSELVDGEPEMEVTQIKIESMNDLDR